MEDDRANSTRHGARTEKFAMSLGGMIFLGQQSAGKLYNNWERFYMIVDCIIYNQMDDKEMDLKMAEYEVTRTYTSIKYL